MPFQSLYVLLNGVAHRMDKAVTYTEFVTHTENIVAYLNTLLQQLLSSPRALPLLSRKLHYPIPTDGMRDQSVIILFSILEQDNALKLL